MPLPFNTRHDQGEGVVANLLQVQREKMIQLEAKQQIVEESCQILLRQLQIRKQCLAHPLLPRAPPTTIQHPVLI